jgi:hypothetical protein
VVLPSFRVPGALGPLSLVAPTLCLVCLVGDSALSITLVFSFFRSFFLPFFLPFFYLFIFYFFTCGHLLHWDFYGAPLGPRVGPLSGQGPYNLYRVYRPLQGPGSSYRTVYKRRILGVDKCTVIYPMNIMGERSD